MWHVCSSFTATRLSYYDYLALLLLDMAIDQFFESSHLFANNIFYYILGIIYFCICKIRCLNNENDPNYILNLIFFHYGIFLIIICFYPSNKLFILFLILYNIIAVLITESLWKKTRIVGYIK